jgi:RNA polymerase-binding transcription factor DksA
MAKIPPLSAAQLQNLRQILEQRQALLQKHEALDFDNEMHGIKYAFLRILGGTYGVCVDCQSVIDFQRLLASPTALRCLTCQEAYELIKRRSQR